MRRLELMLGYFQSIQASLSTGIFFMVYLLVFLEASMITILLFSTGLYLFGCIILGFLFLVSIIAGLKMRKLNKVTKKFMNHLKELGVEF